MHQSRAFYGFSVSCGHWK